MKKYIYAIIIIIVVLGTLLIVLDTSQSSKLTKITIAQAGDFFLYAPLYVAKDAKIFEKYGYDVTIISTGGDEKTWAAVLSNSAQFGVSDPTFIAISDERGKPGKVLASIVNGVPFWGVTYDSNIRPFQKIEDLNGYIVATFPSPSTAYALQLKMFNDARIEPKIREGAFGTILAILKSSQANIGLELEPNVSKAASEGARIVYSLSQFYGDFAITGLTSSPKIISENPRMVQSIVNAIQESLSFIRANKDSTLKILSKRFPEIKYQIAKDALERVIKENIIPKTVLISREAWGKAIQLRKEIGDIKSYKTYNYYVDTMFTNKLN